MGYATNHIRQSNSKDYLTNAYKPPILTIGGLMRVNGAVGLTGLSYLYWGGYLKRSGTAMVRSTGTLRVKVRLSMGYSRIDQFCHLCN